MKITRIHKIIKIFVKMSIRSDDFSAYTSYTHTHITYFLIYMTQFDIIFAFFSIFFHFTVDIASNKWLFRLSIKIFVLRTQSTKCRRIHAFNFFYHTRGYNIIARLSKFEAMINCVINCRIIHGLLIDISYGE